MTLAAAGRRPHREGTRITPGGTRDQITAVGQCARENRSRKLAGVWA